MNDGKKTESINLQRALLIAALAGGLYLVPSALHTSRPGEKESLERTLQGEQVAPARLWQDPLEAAMSYREKAKASKGGRQASELTNEFHLLAELARQIVRQSEEPAENPKTETKLTILQVFISGGTYAEDAESRRRARYAVLSALGVAGYVPFDAEHVGYCQVPWPVGAALRRIPSSQIPPLSCMRNCEQGELVVPFEWFQQNQLRAGSQTNGNNNLLLLWLNADAFDDHPALRLAQFMWELRQQVPHMLTIRPQCSLEFKLLDPRLHRLLNERFWPPSLAQEVPETCFTIQDAFNGMEVYSTFATSADAVLRRKFTGPRRSDAKDWLSRELGINFINATCTDDELASSLCDELARRGVDFSDEKDCVALVSEWDTFYGRALPFTFAAEVLRRSHARSGNGYTNLSQAVGALMTDHKNWPSNVFCFTYLRGVDGKLPGEDAAKPAPGKSNTRSKEESEPDRPEGHSQLDYMPRLAGHIEDLESWCERSDRGQFKAIGILGSDVYDKLLALQTLRPRFKDELFFTTDLDARLLHPSEQAWTRNVIVASSFGLKLRWKLQWTTPPFRDTYQTAQYLATLTAVGYTDSDGLSRLTPRLFEIGRSGAYDLSVDTNASNIYPNRPRLFPKGISRARYLSLKSCWIGAIVVLACALLLLLDPVQSLWRRMRCAMSLSWQFWCLTATGLGLAAVLAGIMVREHYVNLGGEPFALFQGISIWPAEAIRLVAAALSVYFFLKTRHDLRKSKDELSRDYAFPARSTPQQIQNQWNCHRGPDSGTHSTWKCLVNAYRYFCWISIGSLSAQAGSRSADKCVSGQVLCEEYNRLGYFKHRLYRLLANAVVYFLFAVVLVSFSEAPFSPYRGRLSFWVDGVAFWVSLSLQIALTFLVVDATCLCNKFITELTGELTENKEPWSDDTYMKFEGECRIHRKYLDEWIAIQVIAERSRVVGKLIFYPFVGLFLIVISRNNFFDRWDWPAWLLLVLGLNSAYAVYCVFLLRKGVEQARTTALGRLNTKLLRVLGGEREVPAPPSTQNAKDTPPGSEADRKNSKEGEIKITDQIRALIQEIKDYEEGAFAPLSHHPVVGAILMPFGGAGVLALLDRLAK